MSEEQHNKEENEKLLEQIRGVLDSADSLSFNIPTSIDDEKSVENENDDSDYGNIDGSIVEMAGDKLLSKEERLKNLTKKAAKKRKERNKEKKESGIRRPKQSRFNTRSDDYLKPNLRALHIILHDNKGGPDIYKDGTDFAPRMAVGVAHFGNPCKKNVFERLYEVQEKLKEKIGLKPLDYPGWIIISNSSSIILDRDILTRLESLREKTHCAGSYGFERINSKGVFYEPARMEDTRGCYIQSNFKNNNWNFIVGHGFKNLDRYKIICVYGPFIAVRGSTFMSIDFNKLIPVTKTGFNHYMAEISMECVARGYNCASLQTICQQYDNIHNYKNDPDFAYDQAQFRERWKKYFPISIHGIGT